MKLIFATHNPHKAKEINALLDGYAHVSSLYDIGIFEEIPETGTTLEANAIQKAKEVYKLTGLNCFADDTGLEVDALNNQPGVLSARYAGPEKDCKQNIALLLAKMEGILNRQARFRTVICLIFDDNTYLFEGILNGSITTEPRGTAGFGYDPVFLPNGYNKTFAEMTLTEKKYHQPSGNCI